MKTRKYKTVRLLLLILIIVFLIWNVIWYINYKGYKQLVSNEYIKSPINYVRPGENYTYTIDCPSYLRFVGNFAITNNGKLSLIIWPGVFMKGENSYGIGIADTESETIFRFYVDASLCYVHVDEMKYTNVEEERIKELLFNNLSELSKMMELAIEEWPVVDRH